MADTTPTSTASAQAAIKTDISNVKAAVQKDINTVETDVETDLAKTYKGTTVAWATLIGAAAGFILRCIL